MAERVAPLPVISILLMLAAGDVVFYNPNGHTTTDIFNYTVRNSKGVTATGTVTVKIIDDTSPAANISKIEITGSGATRSATVTFAAIPGRSYLIQVSPDMINWTNAGTVTANSDGSIVFVDPPPAPACRFYRIVAQ